MSSDGLLALLRHGESTLNRDGRFSGRSDCPLTPLGVRQAHEAGRMLRERGIQFDVCYTSVLSRTVDTAAIVLRELGCGSIPVLKSWKLNERHYGVLEGSLKSGAVASFGSELVEAWRNSADAIPPLLSTDDVRHPRRSGLYRGVPVESLRRMINQRRGRRVHFGQYGLLGK